VNCTYIRMHGATIKKYIWGSMCDEFWGVHLLSAFRNVVTKILSYKFN